MDIIRFVLDEPEDAAENGLGAAHRGVILGCDGCNRYESLAVVHAANKALIVR